MDARAGAGVVGEVATLATDFHGSARIKSERKNDETKTQIDFVISRPDAAEEFNIAHVAQDRACVRFLIRGNPC